MLYGHSPGSTDLEIYAVLRQKLTFYISSDIYLFMLYFGKVFAILVPRR